MNTSLVVLVPLSLVIRSLSAQATTGTGAISGIIVNDGDKPVKGASLICRRQAEYTSDAKGKRQLKTLASDTIVLTDKDGAFSVSGLAPGKYHLCTSGAANQVGDCLADGVRVIALNPGETVSGLKKTLHDGTTIMLHVSDPNRRIQHPDQHGKVAAERRFFSGTILRSGSYTGANLISSSGVEHVFRLIIPRNAGPVPLMIDSDLNVTDDSGVAYGRAIRQNKNISGAGMEQLTINLYVR